MGAWLVITFVMPQFTSGLRPTQSLNPITDPVSTTTDASSSITSKLRPYSVVEQYKEASGRSPRKPRSAESPSDSLAPDRSPSLGSFLVLGVLTSALINRHDFSRSATNE